MTIGKAKAALKARLEEVQPEPRQAHPLDVQARAFWRGYRRALEEAIKLIEQER